jgi:hypothetical protein
MNFNNSFAILNNIEDTCLIRTAKELGIRLASDDEGEKQQISSIKAEERLRAYTAEAAYQAHLENLKLKECFQEDLMSLEIIDNSHREVASSPNLHKQARKKNRNQRKHKKKVK